MSRFNISLYSYVSDIDDAFSDGYIGDIGHDATGLTFSTNNPGGYYECSFDIITDRTTAFKIYSTYHHNFIRVISPDGDVVWEGRIEDITISGSTVSFVCRGLWQNAFDALYDDGSLYGWPNAEHPITESDSVRNINSTYKYLAQSFQLSESLAIQDIAIRLKNDGSANDEYLTVTLRPDDGSGNPDSVILSTVDIQTELISSTGETMFTGLNTDYALEASTSYWIVIGSNTTVTADKIGWEYDSTSGYSDGVMKYYNTSWAAFSGDAIFYVYTHPRFYYTYGANSLSNPGFETAGTGGSDVWASWTESAGDGSIANETTNIYAGADAAKLTAGASYNTYIDQAVSVRQLESFNLFMMARGDGTYSGRYAVYDNDNSQFITAITSCGITQTVYAAVSSSFTTPAGCTNISIRLYCPSTNTGIAYFDEVALRKDATAADIIYDAITQSHFIVDSRSEFSDIGQATVNPIRFVNNDKPGDVMVKVASFGSSGSNPEGMFIGVYDRMMLVFTKESEGFEWHTNYSSIYNDDISLTSSLDSMKTRVAVLYSDHVGSRKLTDWIANTYIYSRFEYNRDGLFSIAGAIDEVADLVAESMATASSKGAQNMDIEIANYIMNKVGSRRPCWNIKAGDTLVIEGITSTDIYGLLDVDNIRQVYVGATEYSEDSNSVRITPTDSTRSLVDVILALANLSGGSLR